LDPNSGGIRYLWIREIGDNKGGVGSPVFPGELSLGGMTSTALTVMKGAQENSLHIREYIEPEIGLEGERMGVGLIGIIHIKPAQAPDYATPPGTLKLGKVEEILKTDRHLTLGRSRGVGQGRVMWDNSLLDGFDNWDKIPAHCILDGAPEAIAYRGELEPIVLRRFDDDRGAGRKVTYYGLALLPGSTVHPAPQRRVFHGCLAF